MANVRKSYTIRTSLAEGMLDLVVNPTSNNSVIQFKREFTVRTLIFALVDMIVIMWMASSTFLGTGGLIGTPLFFFGYIWLSYLLIRPTKTKLLGYSYVKPLINYLEYDYRHIGTRSVMPAAPFAGVAGVKGTLQDGRIIFNNNDIGCVMELVGNASMLMFDKDQKMVLNNVGNFYRNIKPGITLIYDNVSAPQRVVSQLKAKDQQLTRLQILRGSRRLQALVKTHRFILSDYVGKQYKSLHQYLIVRAQNKTALDEFMEWMEMQTGARNDDNYLRSYRLLTDPDEVTDYLRDIFTSHDLHRD